MAKTEQVETVDSMFAEMLAYAQKHTGKEGVYVASDRDQYVAGIKIPNFALPLQFVIQNNIWPQHRIALLAGPFGSCKTTLAFEISRWYTYSGGLSNYIETENKIDSMHLSSMLGECLEKTLCSSAHTVEEWQVKLTNGIQFFKDRAAAKKPNVFPALYIVDSITGCDTEEGVAYVMEHGHARGRTFSDMSIVLAQYFRAISPQLDGIPVSMLLINHQKRDVKQLPGGRIIEGKRKPGGDSQQFHANLDISVAKAGTIELANKRGLKIAMKCEKNSMGETGLAGYFEVVFSEKEVGEGEPPVKSTWIDWYSSIPPFLNTCLRGARKKNILDVIHVNESSNRYSCPELGLSRVVASELGKAIVADEKLVQNIQDALGIVRRENVIKGPGAKDVPSPGPWYPATGRETPVEIISEEDYDGDGSEEQELPQEESGECSA